MNFSGEHPLTGFEQRLLGELRELIALRADGEATIERAHALRSGPPPVQRSPLAEVGRVTRAPFRRLVAVVSCAAVAGGLVVLLGLSGSSPDLARALPIFARPATDASPILLGLIRSAAGVRLRDAHADVRNARVIRTPLGAGYVLSDKRASQVCLVIPDGAHGWAASCGSVASARRYGAGALMTADSRRAELVAVLPTGASAWIGGRDGKMTALAMRDGVLAVLVRHQTTITTRIGQRSHTVTIAPIGRCVRSAFGGCPSA